MSKLVEEWRPIKDYEGLYEVSDWGRVRSVDRVIDWLVKGKYPAKRFFKGQTLSPYDNGCGYLVVDLHHGKERDKKTIHSLVAETFIPNPEHKPCVGHKDCNTTNNRVENLYWCTYPENNNHPITKERQKKAQKERNHDFLHTKEVNEKRRESLKGHFVSDETKEKMSKAKRKRI